jgi:hypothetical protein
MLLHLIDDEKFIPDTVQIFDSVYPGKNIYLVGQINGLNSKPLYKTNGSIFFANQGSKEYNQIIGDLYQFEAVIFHYLSSSKWELIKKTPNYKRFIWIAWGGDFYSKIPEWRLKLFGKETRKLLDKVRSKTTIERWIRGSVLLYMYRNISAEIKLIIFRKGLKSLLYYSTVLPTEKEIITKHFKLKIPYVPYNYGINTDFPIDTGNRINKDRIDILVGNSGSPTNNHIEIINILVKKGFEGIRIIMPLNYGGSEDYIDNVSLHGRKYFGEEFLSLERFLEQKEYFGIISNCQICIMNHYRQQGSGNVAFMLIYGAKVFLSELNPLYKYFIEEGIIIYSIEKDLLHSDGNEFLKPLDESQKVNNKMILESLYGTMAIIDRAAAFIKEVLTKNPEIVK